MKYKFGVTQWSLPGNGIYAIRLVKEAGLDGLQVELGSFERGYPLAQKRIRDKYLEDGAKYGIEFPSFVLNDLTINDLVHGRDCEKGQIAYEQMRIGVEVASEMNIQVVMIPSFFENFIEGEEHFKNTVEALRFCCDIAGEKGITIASETVLSGREHLRLIDSVDRENIGIFFDSMNYKFFKQHDQMEVLKTVYDRMIPQLHVKDGKNDLSGSALGDGDMDFFKQMTCLIDLEYSGWIIIENYYDQVPLRAENEEDQLLLLMHDLTTLKKAVGAEYGKI